MRSFIPPRKLRATVWVVLGVWLFALVAGMANACVLEPPGNHDHGHQLGHVHNHEDDHDHDSDSVEHIHGGHVVAIDHHDESSSKAPCVKVCGEAAQSLVQKASAAKVDMVGMVGVTASLYEAWTPAQRADQRVDLSAIALQLPPDPPPRLRFARLAL